MFTNRVRPCGLKQAPAHSEPFRLFLTRSKMAPSRVSPRTKFVPEPSSQSTIPPRGLTAMLSGLFSTDVEGDSKISCSFSLRRWYCHTWPAPALPPLVAHRVVARLTRDRQHLESSAVRQLPWHGGLEAVEPRWRPILSLVDPAGAGIGRQRLVLESAHVLQRHRGDSAVRGR